MIGHFATMPDKFYSIIHIIVERVFQLSESKRKADRQKFETFIRDISPEAVQAIHEDLSGCHLKDWQIYVFQKIEDFYASPANKYHNRRLQRKSEKLRKTFDELTKFTSSHFTPGGMASMYRIESVVMESTWSSFEDIDRARKVAEDLERLSLDFGRAYMKFYNVGNRIGLTFSEVLVIVATCIASVIFLATLFGVFF